MYYSSGVYFVRRLCGCGYKLQRDTAALFSRVRDCSAQLRCGYYSRAASDQSYTVSTSQECMQRQKARTRASVVVCMHLFATCAINAHSCSKCPLKHPHTEIVVYHVCSNCKCTHSHTVSASLHLHANNGLPWLVGLLVEHDDRFRNCTERLKVRLETI